LRIGAAEQFEHFPVERGKVVRFTAEYRVTVDDHFLVEPLRAGIAEVERAFQDLGHGASHVLM